MSFSGKEGHPNIQPSTRPGIEPGTSGLGGRDLNHCANPSAPNCTRFLVLLELRLVEVVTMRMMMMMMMKRMTMEIGSSADDDEVLVVGVQTKQPALASQMTLARTSKHPAVYLARSNMRI